MSAIGRTGRGEADNRAARSAKKSIWKMQFFIDNGSSNRCSETAPQRFSTMKKEHRKGGPLVGLTVAAILLASTAGYVSALARMFQAPMDWEQSENDFLFDEDSAAPRSKVAPVTFQQRLGRVAAAWLVNAMPGYSSGRARELWYLSLDSAGDHRIAFDTSSNYNAPVSGSYAAFNSIQSNSFAPVSAGFVGARTSDRLTAPSALLASGTWIGNATGTQNWSDTTKWSGGVIADGTASTADFSATDITGSRNVTIDTTSRSVGTLLVGDSASSFFGYTFAASGGATLTFNNGGSGATLTQTANSGSNVFGSTLPIILADNLTINNNANNGTARTLTISGGITGAFNITINDNASPTAAITFDTNSVNNGGTITNSGTGNGTVTISSAVGVNVTGITQSSATSQLTLSGGITLGTDMTLTANGTKLTLISGAISGAHSFTIGGNGTGTTTLSGANTFSHGLTLSNGTLNLNSATAPGSGTFAINGGNLTNTSGAAITLSNNNAQIWGGDFTYLAGSGSSNLNLGTGSVTLTGNRSVQVSGSTSTLTVGGAIGDGGNGFSLSKVGPGIGTLILAGNSTYSGGTTIAAGTISISSLGNAGANGNLGTGGVNLGGTNVSGVLLYTGAGEISNKVFNLSGTTGGGTIDTTGATGGLILTADFIAAGAGAKTLTLRGNTTGNVISGAIVDNLTGTNNTSLSKTGTGTWTLSGANIYTGTTTVSGGTLAIDNNNTTTPRLAGTTSIIVNSGGTLLLVQGVTNPSNDRINDAAGMTLNAAGSTTAAFNTGGLSEHGANNNTPGIGALTLSSSSIIDLSNGASIIAFANSSAKTWTGTLSIYNWSGTPITGNGTDQVYFGSDATGLNATQLNQISFYSDSGTTFLGTGIFGTDLDGEVVPTAVPEPSTWIGAALALGAVGVTQRKRFNKCLRVIG